MMISKANNYIKAFKTSIVRIYHPNGTVVGAGFLISNQHVITCAHVITQVFGIPSTTVEIPSGPVKLDFPLSAPGEKLEARVVVWQPVKSSETGDDIAGLQLKTELPNSTQPVELVTTTDLWDHSFRVFGFPRGHDNGVWASGVLRAERANAWVQIEDVKATGYRIEPGFSGSPIWDEKLTGVIGMAVAAEKRREEVKAAFMIPAHLLYKVWPNMIQPIFNRQQTVISRSGSLAAFRQIKSQNLQKYLSTLFAKYEAAYNQLNYMLNEADKININNQILSIEQEIVQVEDELDAFIN